MENKINPILVTGLAEIFRLGQNLGRLTADEKYGTAVMAIVGGALSFLFTNYILGMREIETGESQSDKKLAAGTLIGAIITGGIYLINSLST